MKNSVIDVDTFNEIRELMDDELGHFIDTFVDNSPRMIQQITDGMASGNIEAVHLSAHQLKGGSGSIGALRLSDLAFQIEKADEIDKIAGLITQLQEEYLAVESELKALCKA